MKSEDLEAIKPHIQPYLEGKEGAADVIAALQALVNDDEATAEVVDVVNKVDHEAALEALRVEMANETNRRIEGIFFSGAQPIVTNTDEANVLVEAESSEGVTLTDAPQTTADLFVHKEN